MFRQGRRRKRHAVDQRVNRQTETEARPAEIEIAVVVIAVNVMMVSIVVAEFFLLMFMLLVDGQIVLVEMKQPAP